VCYWVVVLCVTGCLVVGVRMMFVGIGSWVGGWFFWGRGVWVGMCVAVRLVWVGCVVVGE